jgi:hypothetical protein
VNPLAAAPKPPDYLTGTETPEEICELIHEMGRHTPIVGKVLDLAEDNRFEDNEHMLLVLAHTALTAYACIVKQFLDYVNKSPIPSFVVSDPMAHVIPEKKAAETREQCEEMLARLNGRASCDRAEVEATYLSAGFTVEGIPAPVTSKVSYRHRMSLDIERVDPPKGVK